MTVKQYLQEHHVPFEVLSHDQVFDAQHLAHAVHVPGREVAKTVLLRADHDYRFVAAVLPATHAIDFDALGKSLGGAAIELASEVEVAQHCPDCEFGVLPPFGSHYGANTVIDSSLTEDHQIVFAGDTHCEAIRMKYHDYYNVEHPLVCQFARRI